MVSRTAEKNSGGTDAGRFLATLAKDVAEGRLALENLKEEKMRRQQMEPKTVQRKPAAATTVKTDDPDAWYDDADEDIEGDSDPDDAADDADEEGREDAKEQAEGEVEEEEDEYGEEEEQNEEEEVSTKNPAAVPPTRNQKNNGRGGRGAPNPATPAT